MPEATARIQRAAQTHSHLSSTRSVIPNGSGLRKGGIKKVTGGCATRFWTWWSDRRPRPSLASCLRSAGSLGSGPPLHQKAELRDSRFPTVVCAPILARGHGFSTQVSVGIDEGLKHESWILCDNLVSLRKVQLTRFVGFLARSKVEEFRPSAQNGPRPGISYQSSSAGPSPAPVPGGDLARRTSARRPSGQPARCRRYTAGL